MIPFYFFSMFIFLKIFWLIFTERLKNGEKTLIFFSPTSSEKKNNNLIAILYSISLYYILDTPPLQLKNVYYTYIYMCKSN